MDISKVVDLEALREEIRQHVATRLEAASAGVLRELGDRLDAVGAARALTGAIAAEAGGATRTASDLVMVTIPDIAAGEPLHLMSHRLDFRETCLSAAYEPEPRHQVPVPPGRYAMVTVFYRIGGDPADRTERHPKAPRR